MPIHLGMHWCLAAVDLRHMTINYYDRWFWSWSLLWWSSHRSKLFSNAAYSTPSIPSAWVETTASALPSWTTTCTRSTRPRKVNFQFFAVTALLSGNLSFFSPTKKKYPLQARALTQRCLTATWWEYCFNRWYQPTPSFHSENEKWKFILFHVFFPLQVKGIPRQLNGSDCGVFTCQYAEYLSRSQRHSWKSPFLFRSMIDFNNTDQVRSWSQKKHFII